MQEQAEADRDGVRVPEEVVWVTDTAEPEAAEGGGGAQGYEGGPTHRAVPAQQRATPSINPNHVSPL